VRILREGKKDWLLRSHQANLDLNADAGEHPGMHPKPLFHKLLASGVCAAAIGFSPTLRADSDVGCGGNHTKKNNN
jgi:hypothetical protein